MKVLLQITKHRKRVLKKYSKQTGGEVEYSIAMVYRKKVSSSISHANIVLHIKYVAQYNSKEFKHKYPFNKKRNKKCRIKTTYTVNLVITIRDLSL